MQSLRNLGQRISAILLSAALAITGVIALDSQYNPAAAQTASSVQNEIDYYGVLARDGYFRAADNVAVIPHSEEFTVEAWVRPEAHLGGDEYHNIITQNQEGRGADPERFQIALRYVGGEYRIHYGYGGADASFRPAEGVPVGAWSHIAVVAGTSETKIFFNGVEVRSVSVALPAVKADNAAFTIGASGESYSGDNSPEATANYLRGGVDQVKVWNGALTEAQLATSMHSWGSEGVTGPTLRAHYDFNDRSAANGKLFNRINAAASDYHLDIVGAPEFKDVKQVHEQLGQQVFTFTRSYLTQIGGWRLPASATGFDTLVVGAGGGGGGDAGGGGGGGAVNLGQSVSFGQAEVVRIQVGQGGAGTEKSGTDPVSRGFDGQQSVIANGSTTLLSAAGGSGGHGWRSGNASTQPSPGGSTGSTLTGSQLFAGAAGGLGPLACPTSSDVTVGAAGANGTLVPFDGLIYGSGGGAGIAITDNTPAQVTNNLGGDGAGRGAFVEATGDATRGFQAMPNRGGGGGGSAACGSADGNGTKTRTLSGAGGSGIVVVAVNFAAVCAFGTNGFSTVQLPKLLQFPLGGQTQPRTILASDNTSAGAWYGKPVIVDGKLYTVDNGRGQLQRVNLDGSDIEYLGPLLARVGYGAATDGRFVYAWGSSGIARFDTKTGEYVENFIGRGVMNTRVGELAFYRHDTGVGYLFITNGAPGLPGFNRGRVFAVPVTGSSVPATITAAHIFAESQLAGGTVQNIDVMGLTVARGKIYWSQFVNTSPGGLIYEKEITTLNLPGGADQAIASKRVADRTVATNVFTVTLSSDSKKIYWNRTNGSIQSLDLDTAALTIENSIGLGSYVATGLLPAKDCALPASNVGASLGEGGTISVNWSSTFESAATYRVEYRVNGGEWLVIDSAVTQTTLDFTPGAVATDLVEVRVAVNAFNQVSEFTNAAPVDFEILLPQPPCDAPTSLVYQIPSAGEGVAFTLVSHSASSQVVVAWGDGQVEPARTWGQNTNSSFSHTYQAAGTYTVSICGDYRGFANSLSQPQTHLVALESWGESVGNFTRLFNAFYGAAKLVSVPTTFPPNVTDARQLFSGASLFNDPAVIGWNVSSVTSGSGMFRDATSFNQPIGGWDTGNFTAMNSMFLGASSFNQNLHTWNTSNVTTMFDTFRDATAFNGRVDTWNTSKVTTMTQMFLRASAFNRPLATDGSTWDVSNVTNMSMMFRLASSFNQDLSSWNTGSVTNMASMFSGATEFNNGEAPGLSGTELNWNTSNVTKMDFMFSAASAFNQPLGASWNTSNVTNLASMFRNAESYNHPLNFQIDALTTASSMLDFSGMSDQNYSTTVENLKSRYDALAAGSKRNNIAFGAVDKTAFCNDPNAAVRFLTDTAGWRITDKTDRTAEFCTPQVTITASNSSHVYGDPVASIGYLVSVTNGPLPESEWLNDITCKAVASGTDTPVGSTSAVSGSYVTKCTGPSGTGLGINVSYADGTYSVTPRPITVRTQDKAAFQGQSSPALGLGAKTLTAASPVTDDLMLTAGSIVAGDTLTLTTASSGSGLGTPGSSAITATAELSEPTSNYLVTVVPGKLTVTALTYIISAKSQTKTYGDSKSFSSADWTCIVQVGSTAMPCPATPSVTVTLTSTGSAASAAASSSTVTHPITVTATISGVADDQIETVNGTLTVTKRMLTVTPSNLTVAYGSDEPTYPFTVSGFVLGQSASTAAGYVAPNCSSGFNSTASRGTELLITCSGGSADNYQFAYGATATLTVLSLSEVTDLVPQTLMLEPEEFETEVGFSFVLTPVAQVCFASLLLFDQNGNAVELDADGNELRKRVQPGEAVSFDVPLIIGSYDYELKVDGNCDIATTSGSFAIQEFVAAVGGGAPGYFGPIISGASTSTIETCRPTLVTLAGQQLEAVMAATVQGRLVRIADKRADVLVIEVPAGLTPATGVNLVLESSFGRLTVQSVFNIVGPVAGVSCAEATEAAQFWTKRISPTQVKFYAKWPVGAGKIQFMLDGREIGWVRAADESDRKLIVAQGRSYFVRTVTLKPGKNRFEIRVDGERVRRATYTGR